MPTPEQIAAMTPDARDAREKEIEAAFKRQRASADKQRVDPYLDTIDRMERDIAHIDTSAGIASIAISLRRIADSLERVVATQEQMIEMSLKRKEEAEKALEHYRTRAEKLQQEGE